MAHSPNLRSRSQARQQPQQSPPSSNDPSWEEDTNDDFDVALHLASHAQRLKNVDHSLDHFEQSLKNFQAVYVQERNRQNMILGALAGCVVLSLLLTALWPRPSTQNSQAAQQRAIQQQLAAPAQATPQPVQMPQAQQTYTPNFAGLQPPVQQQPASPQYVPQIEVPAMRSSPTASAPVVAPVIALGARYDQQQSRLSQPYLAAPSVPNLYGAAPTQPRLSPFQISVQNKLSARGQAVPADWQPLFDREARGDKKGRLLIAAKFLKGDGVVKDQAYAVELIRQAADAGEKEAMMWLAYANQGGNIGKTDINAAIRWFQAAGKAGVTQAYTELGRIYETGADGAPDIETALAWYQRGAQAGDVKAAQAVSRLTAPQQAQQPTQQYLQPSYAPQAPAPSPAQQVQQIIQPLTQNNLSESPAPQIALQQNDSVASAPSSSNDIFVPAPAQSQTIPSASLRPIPKQALANIDSDPDVSPAYPATPVVASVPTPAPSSQVGMSKAQASADNKSIQRMLRVLGYKIDRVDGEYGPQTAAAIRAYQRDRSVYPDGEPSAELIDALMRDTHGQ